MAIRTKTFPVICCLLAVLFTATIVHLGVLSTPDSKLSDFRFALNSRAPTGSIVMIDIDAKSLASIGVWPWKRTMHSSLVSRLEAMGVSQIAFDVDFSTYSDLIGDTAFAQTLTDASVPVFLACFVQQATRGGQELVINSPRPFISAGGWPALVNVPLDADGQVRRFPNQMPYAGETYESMPKLLAGQEDVSDPILIDYTIDARKFLHYSYVDVINGSIRPDILKGKTVIVGATALELRDFFRVPRFGTIPGPEVIALATETLAQHRELTVMAGGPVALLAGLLAMVLLCLPTWWALGALLSLSLGLEGIASALQVSNALVLQTAGAHLIVLVLAAWVLAREYDLRGVLVKIARLETVNTRRMLERVVDDGFDGIVILEETDAVIRYNEAAVRLLSADIDNPAGTGRAPDLPEPILKSAEIVRNRRISGDVDPIVATVELSWPAEQGRILEYVVTAFVVKTGALRRYESQIYACVTLRDVTERQRTADRLRYMATHDGLTGLPNRIGLAEAETGPGDALIYFDLDRFKSINDSLGHKVGDQTLTEIAKRGGKLVGENNTLARMGGDEFAVLCPGGYESASNLAAALLKDFSRPFIIGGHRFRLGASFGIASGDGAGRNLALLLRRADLALNAAKKRGRHRVAMFEAAMEADQAFRLMLEHELEGALDRGEIQAVYQPQFDLASGAVVGAEALMRWRHPTHGAIPPAVFIPIAEETGIIHRLTAWMMERACADAAEWSEPIPVAVNVSAIDLQASDVPAMVRGALATSGLPVARLSVEITESAFVGDGQTVDATFRQLRELGIALALDDYGTGYASLGYLHRYSFSKLKVDKSFVDGIPNNADSVAILKSVVLLSRGLALKTVVEGVETQEQREMLITLGCDIGQGYLFSRPISNSKMRRMLIKEDNNIAISA